MVSEPALYTMALGVGVALVGYLIRVRGWVDLIAGVRRNLLPFPTAAGVVVGTHTMAVGALIAGVGAVRAAGLPVERLRLVLGAVVVLSTVAIPFWGPRYLAWRRSRGAADGN